MASNIYLTGMMGSGKTELAKLVAEKTGMRAVDVDAVVASDTGMSIPEIFSTYGEPYFREVESNVLYDLHKLTGLVVSTGGGSILLDRNVELMDHSGTIVYIERDVDDILGSIDTSHRPLLEESAGNLRRIFADRKKRYEQTAHTRIHNNGTLEQAAEKIVLAVHSAKQGPPFPSYQTAP